MRGGRIPKNIIRRNDKSIILQDQNPKYSLVWLHGLGGQSEHYVSFFSHSQSTVYSGCRVKLLQAPARYMTITKQQLFSWYDIRSTQRFTEPQEQVFNFEQINQTYKEIQLQIEQQINFWKEVSSQKDICPSHRVYIGGMSQGGVMSLHYALSTTQSIPAGAICFSGYSLKSTPLLNLDKLSLLLVHGNRDKTIRELDARNSYKKLLQTPKLVDYCMLGTNKFSKKLASSKKLIKDTADLILINFSYYFITMQPKKQKADFVNTFEQMKKNKQPSSVASSVRPNSQASQRQLYPINNNFNSLVEDIVSPQIIIKQRKTNIVDSQIQIQQFPINQGINLSKQLQIPAIWQLDNMNVPVVVNSYKGEVFELKELILDPFYS